MTSTKDEELKAPLLDLNVTEIFKFKVENLRDLFKQENLPKADGEHSVSHDVLQSLQGADGLMAAIATNEKTGITGDLKDIKRRKKIFGANTGRAVPLPRLVDSVKEAVSDKLTLAMLVAGLFTMIVNPWLTNGGTFDPNGLAEGLSIILAVFLVIVLSSGNDYMKDKQFSELLSSIKNEECTVIRGKSGATQSLSVEELVVGDCVVLEAGTRVSADCILVEGSDVVVNERFYRDGASHKAPKRPANQDGSPDSFILSQSIVVKGTGKAIVCAVGAHSRRDTVAQERLGMTDEVTPLQERLTNLGAHFSKYGVICALAIVGALLLNWIIVVSSSGESAGNTLKKLFNIPIIFIVIIVVAVPEGLPLSIQISLAYSTKTMRQHNILVKRLESIEKMGTIQEVVTGKTGTLTTEDMEVAEWYAMKKVVKNTLKNTMSAYNSNFPQRWQDVVTDAIIFNSDARIEMADDATYVPVGQGTEVCMMKFLQGNEKSIYDLNRERKVGRVLYQVPHSSARARMTTVVELKDNPDTVRVVVKGAPEILLENCDKSFEEDGTIGALEEQDRAIVLEKILNNDWVNYSVDNMGTGKGNAYRSILYAYQDMTRADFEAKLEETNGFQTEEDKAVLESNLILVAVFALRNPLREKVAASIKLGRQGHLNVRMVTGDSEGTARAVALQAGILHPEELKAENAVISGAQFRSQIGGIRINETEDGRKSLELGSGEGFDNIAKELRVIYRATAEDKLALVVGLKTRPTKTNPRGKAVASTGEGVNDESGLQMADVGFAMGGCGADIAKEASDVILTDDNFSSVVKTAMWGRNIYQNLRKFLQFQVTVNLSCCLVVFLGGISMGFSPFNVVQLLWINLVMDIFGALALATEPPRGIVLRNRPVKDGDQIMTKHMWVQIFGVGLWISLITLIVFWAGKAMFGLSFPYGTAPGVLADEPVVQEEPTKQPVTPAPTTLAAGDDGKDAGANTDDVVTEAGIPGVDDVTKLQTIVFNTFMIMHMFNEICCRKVGPTEFNMFKRFFNNWLFLLIIIAQAALLYLFSTIAFFRGIFQTEEMTGQEWGVCVFFGATVLIVSPLLKALPEERVQKIPQLVNETQNLDDDKMMQMFKKAASGKVEAVDKFVQRADS